MYPVVTGGVPDKTTAQPQVNGIFYHTPAVIQSGANAPCDLHPYYLAYPDTMPLELLLNSSFSSRIHRLGGGIRSNLYFLPIRHAWEIKLTSLGR